MTDPVTNMEIEDVLSSIRRLVSENARSEPAPESPVVKADEAAASSEAPKATFESSRRSPAPETPAQGESDRAQGAESGPMLVLTPALRVEEPVADADAPEQAENDDRTGDDHTAEHPADALAAPVEEAVEQAVDQAIDPMLQDAVDEALDEIGAATPEAVVETADEAGEEVGEEVLHLDAGFRHVEPEASDLEDRIAELEAAVAAREDDWEPDGITESDNDAAPVDALAWEDHEAGDDTGHGRGWDAADVAEIEEAELLGDAATGDGVTSDIEAELASIAALTAAATARRAPPDAEKPQPASPEVDLADEVEPAPDLLAEADTVLDEEMLRELVAEIVRQELQGSLGERITRNVRKLVRREIHRALTAREME